MSVALPPMLSGFSGPYRQRYGGVTLAVKWGIVKRVFLQELRAMEEWEKKLPRYLRAPRTSEEAAWQARRKRLSENGGMALWVVSCAIPWGLWEGQKLVPGTLGDILAFLITIVAFFWFFLLGACITVVEAVLPEDWPKKR